MKNLVRFYAITILTALGLGSIPSDVWAGATAPGNGCTVLLGGTPNYGTTGLANNTGSTLVVSCPIPMDHALGNTVTFRVYINDRSATEVLSCAGYVHDLNGGQLGSATPNMVCSNSQTECSELVSASTTVPSQSSSNVYSVQCTIPGSAIYSGIESVRAF